MSHDGDDRVVARDLDTVRHEQTVAIAATALGVLAVGAIAMGALAIGKLVIGRLAIRTA